MLERKKDGVAEWGFTEELVVLVERGVLIKFLEIEPRHWNEIREIPVKFWFETIRLGMGWLSVSLWAGALGSDGRHKGIKDLRQRKRFLPLCQLAEFQFFKIESPIFTFESIPTFPPDLWLFSIRLLLFCSDVCPKSSTSSGRTILWTSRCWLVGRRFGRLVDSGGWLVDWLDWLVEDPENISLVLMPRWLHTRIGRTLQRLYLIRRSYC